MSKKKKHYYQVIYAPCSNCKRIIERIGVYKKNILIGYLGNNCNQCGTFKKADRNEVDYIQTQLPIPERREILYWRETG